ncbi:uncharacterized protein LOC126379259 isoform X2 [Pectinophora gossypiella]|nr:uncharacterized protein LOC126379259 isoform X2 [Pectinophora gossypiella]XP_049883920.1 uncharacterized protein LOC126379259 isoform X2 [Pectinophora gossypiella]XP_049883921.1 uncharacterized protein LOC126379259 isoform X2 [Pectinophora gossypiella]
MPWTRPASVPLGQVWLRFQGKQRDGTPGQKYQVRDMDVKYRQQCLDLMMEAFIKDEPLCHVLNIQSDPEALASIKEDWEECLAQGVSLACFTEVDDQPADLVGFNVIVVRSKGDVDHDLDKFKGVSKQLFAVLMKAESLVDVYQHYGVDAYLSSSGLTVRPEYRGQNIGARLMEARKPLCKALGLNVVVTVFTAKTSQVLAAKCGFELLACLPYKDMKQYGVDLTGCATDCAEVRGIKLNFE